MTSEPDALETGHTSGLWIRRALVVPESELELRATRSGGPGGQNVNKLATRVEVRFDVGASRVLSNEEKHLIRLRLGARISRAGILRVVSQRYRSQARNVVEARRRLAEMLRAALKKPRKRKRTRPPARAAEHRLATKKHRSEIKRGRKSPTSDD